MLEDLKEGILEYETVGEFFADIRKEFRKRDKEAVKAVELRRMEQERRTIEEYVQEFQRAARGSGYEGRLLVEEFKRRISRVIRKKLIEAERPPTNIEQWYEHTTNLDRHWRESRKEKEMLKRRWKHGGSVPKQQQTML